MPNSVFTGFNAVRHRLVVASRFLRPPGKFKRAELREKPRHRIGAFENPVKRFVRLREKARHFDFLPPPRTIPTAKPAPSVTLKNVDGIPKVSPIVLERRLEFLLSDQSIQQQLYAKLRPGLTPYQVELFMWERQMIDLRKIYRAQYLQKLSEVVTEERKLQIEHKEKEALEKERRRELLKQRMLEDKKRRALLKDQQRIDSRVTQTVTMAKVSKRKMNQMLWLSKLERASPFISNEDSETIISKNESKLFDRGIAVPDLLRQLNQNDFVEKSIKKKITGTYNVLQTLLEKSFDILPEDEPQFEADTPETKTLSSRQRAFLTYSGFSDEEKLKLLDEKITLLNRMIEKEEESSGQMKSSLYLQLRDQLEAAKHAYYEKEYVESAQKLAAKSRDV